MYARDRTANLGLFALAAGAWAATGFLLTTRYPDAFDVELLGAGLLGFAVGVTSVPLFWLAVFTRHERIAYRGDWARALRRGAWVGAVVVAFVVLRTQGAFSPPLGLFLIAMVVFVELGLSVRR